jgi:hypothetical protein
MAGFAITGAAFGQFSGPYDPANWTLTTGGNGFVDTSGAPGAISLTGSDDSSGNPSDTDYTIASGGAGSFTFDWAYNSADSGTFDSAYFLVNGVATFLSDNDLLGGGSISVPVLAGDTIGFRVHTEDGFFGAGTLTISNFSAPVPAPGTLGLAALGGLVIARRRRR